MNNEPAHSKIVFQSNLPLSDTKKIVNSQQQQPQQQHHYHGSTQEFNRLVTGAELVESLPKFEQHITETVPLSEINKPFSPFRQFPTIQSSSSNSINSQIVPQPQLFQQSQQLQQVVNKKPQFSQQEQILLQQQHQHHQNQQNSNIGELNLYCLVYRMVIHK